MPCPVCHKSRTNLRRRCCSRECASKPSYTAQCIDCGQEIKCCIIGRPRLRCRRCAQRKARKSSCYKLRQNHRKRCRLYGVPYDSSVTNDKVFARDRYRCHICKQKTLKEFRFVEGKPHPSSPTIDHHPFPLSAGVRGHEWDNVQCACWLCNVKKSSKWSKQRLLFV